MGPCGSHQSKMRYKCSIENHFKWEKVLKIISASVKGPRATLVLCRRAVLSERANKPYMKCKKHEALGKPWQPITLDLQFNEIWKIIPLSQDEFLPRGSYLNF